MEAEVHWRDGGVPPQPVYGPVPTDLPHLGDAVVEQKRSEVLSSTSHSHIFAYIDRERAVAEDWPIQTTCCSRSTISRLPVSLCLPLAAAPNLIQNASFHGHTRLCGVGTTLEAASRGDTPEPSEAAAVHGELLCARSSQARPAQCSLGKQPAVHACAGRAPAWLYARIYPS